PQALHDNRPLLQPAWHARSPTHHVPAQVPSRDQSAASVPPAVRHAAISKHRSRCGDLLSDALKLPGCPKAANLPASDTLPNPATMSFLFLDILSPLSSRSA